MTGLFWERAWTAIFCRKSLQFPLTSPIKQKAFFLSAPKILYRRTWEDFPSFLNSICFNDFLSRRVLKIYFVLFASIRIFRIKSTSLIATSCSKFFPFVAVITWTSMYLCMCCCHRRRCRRRRKKKYKFNRSQFVLIEFSIRLASHQQNLKFLLMLSSRMN